MTLYELVEAKFKSGNDIPVDRISISRKEWDAINNPPKPIPKCCVCGTTTEKLYYDGVWYGWRCAGPDCQVF